MVGNDIVDLTTSQVTAARKMRFVAKVFNAKERAFLAQGAYQSSDIWTLWAMKESCYKYVVQHGYAKRFNPLDFSCQVAKVGKAQVAINSNYYACSLYTTEAYVYCAIGEDRAITLGGHAVRTSEKAIMDSAELYDYAIRAIEQRYGYKQNSVEIKLDVNRIPRIYVDKQFQPIHLSLSHDGKFGAYLFSSL